MEIRKINKVKIGHKILLRYQFLIVDLLEESINIFNYSPANEKYWGNAAVENNVNCEYYRCGHIFNGENVQVQRSQKVI